MDKLRLDLDGLTVDTFDAGENVGPRGTVRGHEEESCSMNFTCGAASRGEEAYDEVAFTRYACCV